MDFPHQGNRVIRPHPSLVSIDDVGAPTSPVMIWQDNRAVDQARIGETFW